MKPVSATRKQDWISKQSQVRFIKSGWPRRTVFERDNTHGLDADRDKFNIHLDATSDDSQVQEHARRHLNASGIATGEVTHTTGPLASVVASARTESVASGVRTISTLRSSRHARPPSDTPKPAVKLTEPPILRGGAGHMGKVNSKANSSFSIGGKSG